jgi:hypothetical protein
MAGAMADERAAQAIERIEQALARIEAAAGRPAAAVHDGELETLKVAHQALRGQVEGAIADIDRLLGERDRV